MTFSIHKSSAQAAISSLLKVLISFPLRGPLEAESIRIEFKPEVTFVMM